MLSELIRRMSERRVQRVVLTSYTVYTVCFFANKI